ncbi:hypothetical protein IKE84_00745 [Candidatus Saccharibacteria bacterium]|nr:hypothetical protein [Candidatus Saccharibacteria bacterium]
MFQNIAEWAKKEWKSTLKAFGIKPKEQPNMMTEQAKTYEINLVPEVKRRMIKAMRFRNLALFVSIILTAAAGGTVMIMATIWEGQNIAMSSQDTRLKNMSDKLNSYDSLGEFLTIQNQLNNIDEINSNKKVLSRVFSILGTILPSGPDVISISELSVDLATNQIRFDAQADAKVSPYIDYRVLESFKKGVSLMKYDYGRYVDAEDNDIPTRCIVETGADGNILTEEEKVGGVVDKYVYAYWLKGKRGCDPAKEELGEDEEEQGAVVLQNSSITNNSASNPVNNMLSDFAVTGQDANTETSTEDEEMTAEEMAKMIEDAYNAKLDKLDDYGKELARDQLNSGVHMNDVEVIKIYRSPKFSEWYKEGHMDESGTITGIPHFNSECIVYSGADVGTGMRWTSNNDCMLSTEAVSIRDSSNGRNSDGDLVLRFSATITLDENVFKFINKHVMAISPTGQNVTDSYVQIQSMFAERAADCSDGDVVCTTATTDLNTEGSNE